MKRREYGINLDDGVALSSEEEFRLFYVPCNPDETECLRAWFTSDMRESLLLGGQIGSGKTTLIREVSRSFVGAHVVKVSFDTDPIEPTDGGYSMLLFGRIVQACLRAGVEVEGAGISPTDFPSLDVGSWDDFKDKMVTWPANLRDAEILRDFCRVIAENTKLVREACGQLLDRLRNATSREPVIIAEGIDKFKVYSTGYDSLRDTLTFLAKRKTLFEVNSVHLFHSQDFGPSVRKLFVGGIGEDMLVRILRKRLGSYAPVYQDAFSLIISYSGGNARQAMRLLNAYYFQRSQHKSDLTEAIAMACHQVSKDLLNIPYASFPTDILEVVKRDGYIEGGLFADLKTKIGAIDVVYYNWLFIKDEPDHVTPTQWPAIINPLISEAIGWEADSPRTPEEEAARKWASDHDMSPLGLNFPVGDNGLPAWDKFWDEIESSLTTDALNITGVLEEIAAGLFGIERQDRIIVTYRERVNLEIVRDFLVGEANTYATFPCEEITLEGGDGREPIVDLLARIADPDPNRIYSVELTGKWTEAQLRNLDHRRDVLGDLQMLWWIQHEDLKLYLRYWPQLRQYFRIYRLEDDLLGGITFEEVQADIDFIKGMSEGPDQEGVRRLSTVLTYLKEQ